MGNMPPNKTRRLVFMISGATDALIGAILLLIGFGLLPLDVTQYGFENWHVNLLGGVMFILGTITFAYNLSRWEE
jgi:ABC-type branched-subunit amino acid transport system permease subunit